nr:DegV family protein [Peptoniphilus timonensis]
MTFKIISDSSCDLDKKTLEDLDIEIFRIKTADEEGEDLKEDISNQEIYKKMREGAFFKTSQITFYEYLKNLKNLQKME